LKKLNREKKPIGSIQFYKPETEKTKPIFTKPKKTESNRKNRAKTEPNLKTKSKWFELVSVWFF
jgi:hypothetical protein